MQHVIYWITILFSYYFLIYFTPAGSYLSIALYLVVYQQDLFLPALFYNLILVELFQLSYWYPFNSSAFYFFILQGIYFSIARYRGPSLGSLFSSFSIAIAPSAIWGSHHTRTPGTSFLGRPSLSLLFCFSLSLGG